MAINDFESLINSDDTGTAWLNFSREDLECLPISPANMASLVEYGLPEWVAPNIHFYKKPKAELASVVLGKDRNDNLIVTYKNSNILLAKDPIDGANEIYLADDVEQLLSSLAIYWKFVDEGIREFGDQVLLDNNFSDSAIHRLADELATLDKKLISENSFWSIEIRRLLSHEVG